MATYEVSSPDGQKFEVTAPDTATEQEVLAYAHSQFGQETKRPEWSDLPSNIPKSAGKLVSGIAQTFAHPVDTLTGLQKAVSGGYQNLPSWLQPVSPETIMNTADSLNLPAMRPEDKNVSSALGQHYKDRYGGLENIRNTLITDPVGSLADASVVAGGAGLGLKAAGAGEAARVANTVSSAIDPIANTIRAAASARPLYKYATGATTSRGANSVEQALQGSKEFTGAMRGDISEGQIAESAKDALGAIREKRGDAYRAQLEKVKNSKEDIPIEDIKAKADEWLTKYNVKRTPEGDLDFSRASTSSKSANDIKQVYEMVQEWGSKPGDTSPAMLDILKRRLDDFYAEGNTSRAMVTSLRNAVKDKLVKTVPEYSKMVEDYEKSSELIKEMEQALSLGHKSAADTAIRKLTVAISEDKGFRRDLMQVLDQSGDKNVSAMVAGLAMKPVLSKSLGTITTATTVGSLAALMHNPLIAGLIPLASPRVVGELSVALGKLGKAAPYGRGTGVLAYQVGRPQDNKNEGLGLAK
jgi:hypothetical protein